MATTARASHRGVSLALSVTLCVLLGGCGSRLGHGQVIAAGSPATVSLDPATIAELRRQAAPAQPQKVPDARRPGSTIASPTTVGTVRAAPAPRSAANLRRAAPGPASAVVAAPSTAPSSEPAADTRSCAHSLPTVAIGQVGTFSGVAGAVTASARGAMAVWAKDVNARGGLACHPVQLFTEDDAGDPGQAAAAVKDLVARHHVVALVGSIVIFSIAGFLPAVTEAKVPAVGGDSTSIEWYSSPWMFPQGDSIDDQARSVVQSGVAAGHKKLGFLYCVEVPACGYLDKRLFHDGGAQAAGAEPVYDSPISITQPDFTAQCLNARNAGVDLLGVGMDGSAMSRVARSCLAVGYRPLLAAGSLEYTLKQTEDPNLRAMGIASGSPVAPWMVQDTPATRAFHDALTRWAPEVEPDGEAMLAWSAGKLFEAAMARLTPAERAGVLDGSSVLAGLGRIHGDNLGGLTGPLNFEPGEKHATSNGCNYFERLGPNGWTTSTGSTPVCR